MRNIIISDGVDAVELRNDLVFEIQHEELSKRKVMASGKIKKEVIGYRPVLNIPTGYVKLEDLQKLKRLIMSGGFLRVDYPGVDGDKFGYFDISAPKFKSFKYDNDGVSVWYGVSLTCRAQEVEI